MTSNPDTPAPQEVPRRRTGLGVVGVILKGNQFLLIRRSKNVSAPGLVCFAGGGVEPGESEETALIREMNEELNLEIQPTRRLWESVNRWGTRLGWWLIELDDSQQPDPNPEEVAEYFWHQRDEILQRDDLLGSMPDFLAAWDAGLFELPVER